MRFSRIPPGLGELHRPGAARDLGQKSLAPLRIGDALCPFTYLLTGFSHRLYRAAKIAAGMSGFGHGQPQRDLAIANAAE